MATATELPVGFSLALDCDTGTPGVQTTCILPLDAAEVDVGVVISNNTAAARTLGAFDFEIVDPNDSTLVPPDLGHMGQDVNPDLNNALLGSWSCAMSAVSIQSGAGSISSTASCFASAVPPDQVLAAGQSLNIAQVHYLVPPGATNSSVTVSIAEAALFDHEGFTKIGTCGIAFEIFRLDACSSTTVALISPADATATAEPRAIKIPAGNAANADVSVPKSNLWLCVAPALCGGPGEGSLRVVEHVTNVHTGDQNGDSIEDGLGAYEFSVEYDNNVIQSVNPCDVVFGPGGAGASRGPVDELNASSPANADCSPDPGGAGNGTCTMSFVLENVVRFGCVTNNPTPAGPAGDFDLASLVLVPHPDLRNDIFPGNNNGVLTVLKDNGCELVDVFGHAVTGSVNGGLTPVCGDLAVTVRILEGDLNLDCKVDVTDEQLISFRYGGFFGDLLYQKWFDVEPATHDLDIDIKDLQKVFGRDQSNCQAPVPEQPPLDPPAPFGD
jgi:hypothetical protein